VVDGLTLPAVGRNPRPYALLIRMTTNWIQIVEARGITPADPVKFAAVLDSLETAFRPLLAGLAFETEPAITLSEQAVAGS